MNTATETQRGASGQLRLVILVLNSVTSEAMEGAGSEMKDAGATWGTPLRCNFWKTKCWLKETAGRLGS